MTVTSTTARHALRLAVCTLLAACSADGQATDNDAVGTVDAAPDVAQVDAGPDIPPRPTELTNGTTGEAFHVIDGDTLDLSVGYPPVHYTVRLLGLDTPECLKGAKQTPDGDFRNACVVDDDFHGVAAYEALKAAVDGKTLAVSCDGVAAGAWCKTDQFGRYLVFLKAGNEDLSTKMAFDGHGFARFGSSKRAAICAAEYSARDADRGMWAAGTVAQVLAMMSADTEDWYDRFHDKDCDKALGN